MANVVEVRHAENAKGKGLFAAQPIAKGAVIFEEDPLVSCQFPWNALYGYKACHHCMRPLETAQENARRLTGNAALELPYPDCCTTDPTAIVQCPTCAATFCTQSCLAEAAQQYHTLLCPHDKSATMSPPLGVLEEAWRNFHYPPESNTITLIVRLLARILQAPDRELAVRQTLGFCHRTVSEDSELAHKLLGERFEGLIADLHALFLAAIPRREGLEQFLTLDGFRSLLALIGTNAQGVGSSAVSQWVTRCGDLGLGDGDQQVLDQFIDKLYDDLDKKSGTFLNNEGVALYTLQSASNHSCSPNAEPAFMHNSHRLSLVALEDIAEGEEICISYLDDCSLGRSRHSRRKELVENYIFACECPRCEEQKGEPDVTSDEEDDEDMSD